VTLDCSRSGRSPSGVLVPFVFLLSLTISVPAVGQEPLRRLSLEEAIEMALEADPAMVSGSAAVVSARAEVLQARGAWLPSLTMNSVFSNSSNERFDQTTGRLVSQNYTAQASASMELWSWGRRPAVQRSAGAQLRAADASFRSQRYQTMLATTRAFYDAAASVELMEVAGQRLRRAEQQLSFAETRLEVGSATRSDLLRAQLELGNAELSLLDAEQSLVAARLQLGRQVGVDAEIEPVGAVLPETAPALPDVASVGARAETVAPARLAAEATLQERRSIRSAVLAGILPSLRASGGYDWFSFDFPPDQRSWSVRVFASVPVFNGFQREAALMRVRAAEQVAAARFRDAVIEVRVAAENVVRQIAAAERRVEIAGRAIELAREDLRVQEERYQIGATTILELQASQLALSESEASWIRQRQALGVAVAELEAVLGEPVGASAE
jgi:outer membrane protein